jgi:hypothetical protein
LVSAAGAAAASFFSSGAAGVAGAASPSFFSSVAAGAAAGALAVAAFGATLGVALVVGAMSGLQAASPMRAKAAVIILRFMARLLSVRGGRSTVARMARPCAITTR